MPAPTRYRSSRPLRMLLFAAGSALVVAMVLWGTAQALDRLSIVEERSVTAYRGVTAIDLRHAHGDVTLLRAEGDRVRVAVDSRHGFLAGHDRSAEQVGGELRLRGSCDFVNFGTCEDDYRIEVPAGVAVSVRTSAGEAVADGLRGDLELRSSAGPVRARDVRGGTVELRSNAGPVTAEGVRADRLALRSHAGNVTVGGSVAGDLHASTSAGPVEVELLRPPLRLEARSSAGPVTAVVPDVGYAVDADTAAGPEEVLVRQRPGARRTIVVRSSAGPVTVRRLPAGAALGGSGGEPGGGSGGEPGGGSGEKAAGKARGGRGGGPAFSGRPARPRSAAPARSPAPPRAPAARPRSRD